MAWTSAALSCDADRRANHQSSIDRIFDQIAAGNGAVLSTKPRRATASSCRTRAARMCSSTSPPSSAPACAALAMGRRGPACGGRNSRILAALIEGPLSCSADWHCSGEFLFSRIFPRMLPTFVMVCLGPREPKPSRADWRRWNRFSASALLVKRCM
jgi:hypothetical protein